jgi:lipoprotein-anchoring transpeptidase ErfK/SrfK
MRDYRSSHFKRKWRSWRNLLPILGVIWGVNVLNAIPPAQITVKVNLAQQMLYIARNGAPIFSTPVETGSPQTPTLPGVYHISYKSVSYFSKVFQKELPYFLRLDNSSFPIHYFPSRGKFSSHGSIRITNLNTAKQVYDLVPLGTDVTIE